MTALRRIGRIGTLAVAAALGVSGLVACSSSSGGGGGSTGATGAGAQTSSAQSAAPSGSGSQSTAEAPGASSGAAAPTSGTVKIGFFAPESGVEASDGKSALDAAQLAVKDINASGGIGGAAIDLVNYDDGSDPKQAVTIATKLTTQDKVSAVVSGSYSDQTLAAASVFQRAGVPMLASYAVNPGIPKTGDAIFQIDMSGPVEGRAGAVALSTKLGAKKIAIVAIDNDFGHALVDGFTEQAKKLGATVVATDFNQFGEKDFGPVIDRDVKAGADGFYLVEYAAEGQQFLTTYNQRKLTQKIVGTEGIDSTVQFIEPNAKQAEGMVFTTSLNRDSTDPKTQKFLADFSKAYGHAPDMVAATTYDAFMVLKAGSTKGNAAGDLKAGVAALNGFSGVTGTIQRFDDRVAVRPVDLEIFTDGAVHHYGVVDDQDVITP